MYIYLTVVTVQFEGATTINQTASQSSLGDRHLHQVGKQSEHCYKSRNSSSTPAAADSSSYLYLSMNVSLMVMSTCYLLYMNFHH